MTTRTLMTYGRRVPMFALLVATLGLAGCDLDELLTVEDRDVVSPEVLEDPEVLPVVVAGALGDFTAAFSGSTGGDSYVTVSALMADEFFSSGSFPTRTATDRRSQQPPASGNTSDAAYVDLQVARRALRNAAIQVAEVNGTDDPEFAELKALEGYTILLLGEGFCNAVPLSYGDVNTGEIIVNGTPVSSSMLFDSAIARFDEAIAAGGDTLAMIGKARALLDQGDAAAAAAVAAQVETDYVYAIQHSTSGSSNDVFSKQNNGRFSQSDLEGGNGVAFRSAGDPRTPWEEDPLGGFIETIPLYMSLLHTGFADPLTLADGVEARLIEAEALLEAGVYPGVSAALNDLRASNPRGVTLSALPIATTEAAARDQLFDERAYWLFLTGHRLYDLRRLVWEYGQPQGSVYPTGEYHKGATYGDDVVFPIDFDEGNNPNFDPSACVVTDAGITGT